MMRSIPSVENDFLRAHRWPLILACGALMVAMFPECSCKARSPYGSLELEIESDYSHILVRRKSNLRTLLFVRDTKEEVVESILDLNAPSRMVVPYTQYMFLSYAFVPEQENALIVGLGGGSMVHFLQRHDPSLRVDVVEIDPAVVSVANRFFGVASGEKVNIMTMDGVQYLRRTESKYDVIYMDAFLKPSADTDATGTPLRLKTAEFYKQVRRTLKPSGAVVFNLNPHAKVAQDIEVIGEAFPQVYVFRMPQGTGFVLVASESAGRLPRSGILERARSLDKRFEASFSFRRLANRLAQ